MKKKKLALFQSVVSLILCFSMLVGTTFAWFTDSVVTGLNTIAAGNLDVELYHSNAAVTDQQVDATTKLFLDLQGMPILWEPGVVSYENLRIENAGDLALAYQMAISSANENHVVDSSGEKYGLSQILKVGVVEGGITATDRAGVLEAVEDADWTTLADFVRTGSLMPEDAGESEKTWGIVIYWEPGANDNLWNLNNGKQLDEGEYLMIDLGIKLIATQEQYESDSFGDNYDATAKTDFFPVFTGSGSVSTPVTPNDQNQLTDDVILTAGQVSATVPAGVQLTDGTKALELSVSEMNNSGANIVLGENEAIRSLDVHVNGVDTTNQVPITVTLKEVAPKGLNMGNYKLYHVEGGQNTVEMTLIASDADFTAHNQFKYDPATGDITLYMATFSEVALVADTENAWEGKFDYIWYDASKTELTIANADQLAGFGAIVGGMNGQTRDSFEDKTVKLIADVNLGDAEEENNPDLIFYPIGYYYNGDSSAPYSTVYSFEGTFDGNGHTIANFYQNTWEIKGDYDGNYYKDAMGLFGYVVNGAIKNLTVDHFSSDGEYTPTGVIAAYADGNSTFENIAITNCNPRVYNTGNGGIIGIAGDTSAANDDHITLKNITVDNSNKISALWGSWDVACGGLVGMYRGNVDGSGNATDDTISFENCHVSAQIDVYNDVCANYQYYAYRYAGMIIGSVRHNTTNDDGKTIPNMTGISASGCTVNYGDWNDYYYCEFEKNSMASYSEDYQFSRVPHSELNFTDSNGNGVVDADERASVTGCNHTHTAEENHQAIYLPFHQLFTGYSWGVSSIGLKEYSGIVTNLDITEGDQEASVVKFDKKFTGNFLYRVGNKNIVSIGSLFAAKDGVTINNSGVVVTIDKVDENSNVSGTFTANTTDWTKGTIQFSGTGVVKVTIQDYNFCTPTVLYLEVVDATNVAEGGKIGNYNTSSVLLGNTTVSTLYLNGGATLYGNGFTIDCTNSPISGSGSVSENYIIALDGAHLNNVLVKGLVYPEYGAQASNNYNRALVVTKGNSTITNCDLSNTASPIRLVEGNLHVKGTTVRGGNFANIDVRNGHLIVEDVTTINQANANEKSGDTTVVGLGIVVYYENVDSALTSVTIKGTLTQHNLISSSDKFSNTYAQQLVNEMMGSKYSVYQIEANGATWVNSGIIAMCSGVIPVDDRSDKNGYVGATVSFHGDGYVYTVKPNADSIDKIPSSSVNPEQGAIAPTYSFDYTGKNYIAKTDENEPYCYYDNGRVQIAVKQGESLEWDPFILTATKNGKNLDYTVTYNGKSVQTGEKIAFNTAGEYVVSYTYVDEDNYIFYAEGELVRKEATYTKTVKIVVSVIKPSAKHATFTFADTNTTTEKIIVNDKTYISAKGVTATDKEWGYITVNGTKIFYPITEAQMKTSKNWKNEEETRAYYYVWKDTVTITDTTNTYSSTDTPKALPASGFSVVNGYQGKYTGISSACKNIDDLTLDGPSGEVWDYFASSTNSSTTNYDNHIAYQSPTSLGVSGRNYDAITIAQFSYKDEADATYYYFVGYYMPNQTGKGGGSGCLAEGTMITLADGTQKPIEQITYEDELLAWDFNTGSYAVTVPSLIEAHQKDAYRIINLKFADNTTVHVVVDHGFFDVEENNFVFIDEKNVDSYIGHKFVKMGANGTYGAVELIGYDITVEEVTYYSIQTAIYNNSIADGMFTLPAPPDMLDNDEWFDYFEIGEGMKYDEAKMQADIEKYGLYEYSDFAEYVTYEQFIAFNGPYLKVLVGRGVVTFEQILNLIATYVNP